MGVILATYHSLRLCAGPVVAVTTRFHCHVDRNIYSPKLVLRELEFFRDFVYIVYSNNHYRKTTKRVFRAQMHARAYIRVYTIQGDCFSPQQRSFCLKVLVFFSIQFVLLVKRTRETYRKNVRAHVVVRE